MASKEPDALITDPEADLGARIEALQPLLEGGRDCVPVLLGQLESEIARDDTRFVIYLFGTIRKIYDRSVIPLLTKLLRTQDLDLAFRQQSAEALWGLFRQSLAGRDLVESAVEAGRVDDPAIRRFVAVPQPVGQVYEVTGEALDDADLGAIETALQATAADPDLAKILREQVAGIVESIRALRDA